VTGLLIFSLLLLFSHFFFFFQLSTSPTLFLIIAAIPLTLNSLLLRAAALYPDRPFLGRRVGSGPFVWKTYNDAADEIYLLACALRASGLRQGDRVALYSHNSPFWVLGASGASSGAMPTVPLYDSWG
jgi:long-subunit acyl-CoA synthetase (AMP-forming)